MTKVVLKKTLQIKQTNLKKQERPDWNFEKNLVLHVHHRQQRSVPQGNY